MNLTKKSLLALLMLILAISSHAQQSLSGKAISKDQLSAAKQQDLLTYFTDYQIFSFDIKKSDFDFTTKKPQLDLALGKELIKLNLFDDNLSVQHTTEDMPLLLGGNTWNGGSVSLTINDDFIYGFIRYEQTDIFIEPLRYLVPGAEEGQYLVYRTADIREDKEHVCGFSETEEKTKEYLSKSTTTGCKLIKLAIANTYDMVNEYGSATNVMNHNLAVLNNVQTNYRSEFDTNIEFDVVAHYVPTSSGNNPLSPNTGSTDAAMLLANYMAWAQGDNNDDGATGGFGTIYDMGTLWTTRNIQFNGNGGVVGLAYTPGWHHILEDYTTSAANLMAMVTHEKGHNLSAQHDEAGANFIMAPSVTVTMNWSPASKNSIQNRMNSISTLHDCSTAGPPVAGFFQEAVAVCAGNSIDFEDQSQYGDARTWTFTGATMTTSTNEKTTPTYNNPGLYPIQITASNAAGNDTAYGYVDIEDVPANPCAPSGGTGGNAGITMVNVNNLYMSSPISGLYGDYTCANVATLEPNSDYTLLVGVEGVTKLRYFIDYNGDGDFTDSGEASSIESFSGNGTLPMILSTPASPTLATMLRMRIIVSIHNIDNTGCTVPSTGQVEDYGVYFPDAHIVGCMDSAASNYNPNATIDSQDCHYGGTTWYVDNDGDGYGHPTQSTSSVNQPSGYVSDNSDCNDSNANVYPGRTETCDNLDNDCDGQVDEGISSTYFRDIDGDGYGNSNISLQACSQPSGYVSNSLDCNDYDNKIHPGHTELCDTKDNDCDGQVDEGCDSDGGCDGAFLIVNTLAETSYQAEVSIQSAAQVSSTSNIVFTAGNNIQLNAGFEILSGTDFEGLIQPCGNNAGGGSTESATSTVIDEELIFDHFDPETIVNLTIITVDDIVKIGGFMPANEIAKFINNHIYGLNKGSYRMIINNMNKELVHDLIVVN